MAIIKVDKIIWISLFYLIINASSCRMKTFLLENKSTRVPVNKKVYKNKDKFDISILNRIDTAIIYKEIYNSSEWFGIYKFYPNGNMNWFYSKGSIIPGKDFFNPMKSGYRGIYYKKNEKIMGNLFAEENGLGWIGSLENQYIVTGDTLIVNNGKGNARYTETYIKVKLPAEYFIYTANW